MSNYETRGFVPDMWITPAPGRRRQRRHWGRGVLLEIFASWDVVSLLQAIGPWRTAVHRYLSSLFLNNFSFIRHFEVVSDGIERRTGADIHKGHKTDSNSWCRLPWWLISTEHLLLFALIHAPCINGYINICIHVQPVSCNPFKDMQRWRAGALNPYNETRWYNLFKWVSITNSCHSLHSRLIFSTCLIAEDLILTFRHCLHQALNFHTVQCSILYWSITGLVAFFSMLKVVIV